MQIVPTGISNKNYERPNSSVPKSSKLPNNCVHCCFFMFHVNTVASRIVIQSYMYALTIQNTKNLIMKCTPSWVSRLFLWLIASWPIRITLLWPPSARVRGCEVGHVCLTCSMAFLWWWLVRKGCQAGVTQPRSTTERCLAPFNAFSLSLTLMTCKLSHGNQFRRLGRIHLSINNV